MKFTFPKNCAVTREGQRTELREFTMRETDGRDEEIAAMRSSGDKGKVSSLEHLVMLSMQSVNGEPVNVNGKTYLAFLDWNSRARQFAVKAYNALNAVTRDEEQDFLAAAEPE